MRAIVSLGVILLWAGLCFGGTVTVTGQIVDFQARPVRDAEVAVVENDRDWRTELSEARVCGPIVRTDDRGQFEVEAEAYSTRDMFVVARKPGLALAWDRAPLDAPGASRLAFRLVMEKPQMLSGVVVDASGKALAGAVVRAVPKTCYLSTLSQSPISLPESWLSARTDREGRFRFDAFSVDVSCDFWVRAEGCACVHVFTPHHLSGLGYEVGRPDVRLVLPEEYPVRGRVVEQGTDKPVGGLDLEISPPDDRRTDIRNQYLAYHVRSDADGAFVFPGVLEGEHEIEVAYPKRGLPAWVVDEHRVLVAADYAADNVKIEAVPGGIVEVLVRDARTREPLSGIRVSFPNLSVSRLPYTDSNGVARACLRPGESRTLISSGMGRNREYRGWGIRGVNERFFVIRGETTRLELDLDPAGKVRGIVVDPDGKPAAGVTVKIHPLSTGSQMLSNVGDTLCTDLQGRFELACGDEDPVRWFATAHCQERGWGGVAEITRVDEPVKISLRPGVTVKGVVVGEGGSGIPAARVTVLAHISGMVSNVRMETLCDGSGAFSIPGVLPADAITHRLCVDASGYGPKSYVDIEISNQVGATTDLGKIVLSEANASLAGVVVDANDQPVSGVPIFLNAASREVSQPPKTAATDEAGRFRFTRICAGPVHLQANFSSSPQGWASTKAEAGLQEVRIVLHPGRRTAGRLASGAVSRGSPQYASLAGKGLGQVEGLASLIPPECRGKALLVLFMDQQQRPSRAMVQGLAGRTDWLKDKGIEVVVVQVAAMDRTELDRWATEGNVPFKIRMMEGDFERRRTAWGVRAIPWLILADKDHKVTAEGFGLDELDAKIEATK